MDLPNQANLREKNKKIEEEINFSKILEDICIRSKNPRGEISNIYGEKQRRGACLAEGWMVDRGLDSYEMGLRFPITYYVKTKLNSKEKNNEALLASSGTLKKEIEYIVLDLGCGSGKFLSEIEKLDEKNRISAFGLTNMLFKEDQNQNRIILGDLNAAKPEIQGNKPFYLPEIPTGSVDLIVSNCALMYVDKWAFPELFSQINRMLVRGGMALLDTMNKEGNGLVSSELIAKMRDEGINMSAYDQNMKNKDAFSYIKIEK